MSKRWNEKSKDDEMTDCGLTVGQILKIIKSQDKLVTFFQLVFFIGGIVLSLWYWSPAQFITALFFIYLLNGARIKS